MADLLRIPIPTSAPMARLVERLDKVRRAGKGYSARCPAHSDRSASLSVSEAANGSVLLHCFAGCAPADVLAAVGLSLGDLFPERLRPATPQERAEALRFARESKWQAALGVVDFECCIVLAGACSLKQGLALSDEDQKRIELAVERLREAREVLRVR